MRQPFYGHHGEGALPEDSLPKFPDAECRKIVESEDVSRFSDAAGSCEPNQRSRIDGKATTVVARLTFQGRDFRVHFDGDAPPDCDATTVADRTLSCGPIRPTSRLVSSAVMPVSVCEVWMRAPCTSEGVSRSLLILPPLAALSWLLASRLASRAASKENSEPTVPSESAHPRCRRSKAFRDMIVSSSYIMSP